MDRGAAVLCYVEGDWAYFTTQPLDKQWGDDWNGARAPTHRRCKMDKGQSVLCYVEGDWAYFTTQALERQWGDDWNK